MKELKIKPHDLLFFRDAKPMSAGEGYGNGCNMPNPNILHSAIRTALLKNDGLLPKEKTSSTHSRDKGKNRKYGIDKFGSLQVMNLFPYHDQYGILFPIPKDVLNADRHGLKITVLNRIDDKRIVPVSTIPPTKERVSGFWTELQLIAYLKKETVDFTPVKQEEIWQPEWRVGVEIEGISNSSKEGQLYAGEYMRLDDKSSFVAEVSINESEGNLSGLHNIHFGGEKKLASISEAVNIFPEWNPSELSSGCIVKWILLTPAIFGNGALPSWLFSQNKEDKKPVGNVRLQPRIDGVKTAIEAELLCCSVGDPKPISGWDTLDKMAKPSLLSVQSGSVYYFKCTTKEDAKNLVKALHSKNRSDMLSEQGFGFGVCSIENNIFI